MSALLWILGTGLFFLILLILCLAAPVRVNFRGEAGGQTTACLGIALLAGAVRFQACFPSKEPRIFLFGKKFNAAMYWKNRKRDDKKEGEGSKHKLKKAAGYIDFIDRKFLEEMVTLFMKLWNCLGWDKLDIKGSYGLSDPALTGALCGLLNSLPKPGISKFNFAPVFTGAALQGSFHLGVSVRPIRVLIVLLAFLTRPVLRKFFRQAITYMRRTKVKEAMEYGY